MFTGSPLAGWAATSATRLAIIIRPTRTTLAPRIVFSSGNDVDLGRDGDRAGQRVAHRRGLHGVLPQLAQDGRVGVGLHVELYGHLVESRVALRVEAQEDEVVLLGGLERDLEIADGDPALGRVEHEAGGQARAERAQHVLHRSRVGVVAGQVRGLVDLELMVADVGAELEAIEPAHPRPLAGQRGLGLSPHRGEGGRAHVWTPVTLSY